MRDAEITTVEATLGRRITAVEPLAGGFSHGTSLVRTDGGAVVVRAGGKAPAVEASVMAAARRTGVPVPEVRHVVPAGTDTRPMMIIEFVPGTSLEEVLTADGGPPDPEYAALGAEVARVLARVGRVRLPRPGFFADADLRISPEPPWSRQLPDVAADCMERAAGRLNATDRRRWVDLCAAHAPALARVDAHARLVHSDANPKNILVTRTEDGWRVAALLDWEFAYGGCPYADAANMTRFAEDYPPAYVDGFRAAFAAALPRDLGPDDDWRYLGDVLDMFAFSDLVTRPGGNPIGDRAAVRIRRLVAKGPAG